MEEGGDLPLRPQIRQASLQHRQPAEVHVRIAPPGARHRVLPHRLRGPLQEDARVQRQRDADRGQGREEARHHEAGHAQAGVQEALRGVRQRVHRGDDPPLRDPGGEHGPQHLLPDRRPLLQEDHPALVRGAVQQGPRLQGELPRQLVPPPSPTPRSSTGTTSTSSTSSSSRSPTRDRTTTSSSPPPGRSCSAPARPSPSTRTTRRRPTSSGRSSSPPCSAGA